jgi:hypothetical protein
MVSGFDLRAVEAETIRAFVARAAGEGLLAGEVLDHGCGRQPYRDLIEDGGGTYHPYDRVELPANVSRENIGVSEPLESSWDAILSTQVLQYVADPQRLLFGFHAALSRNHAVLVMTGPTSWPIVETEDLWRFTPAGVERMLRVAGFDSVEVERRGAFSLGGDDRWCLGWQAVARA